MNAADQQKGVDTLIVRDVMVLSQERSIDRAVVLAGDEDLREGIEYAQDRGVLLTVVGIADRRGNRSQSIELRREADEALALASTALGTLTILAPNAARAPHSPAVAPQPADRGTTATEPAPVIPDPDLATVAQAIAAALINEITDTDRAALAATKPACSRATSTADSYTALPANCQPQPCSPTRSNENSAASYAPRSTKPRANSAI